LEAAAASTGARFVVQAGTFADAGAAKDARAKLERAGMKTYTHVAETKDGKRTRVRVGPVASLAEADKLAERIKKLDLPAQVLAI
jgi:DedD protein